ncbi:MAG TPA: glycosyltransferase family 39 protein [Nitrospirales bacterium]|nr:glycosyltransferase family 39 protein [Nitrospirales bacterium]
MSTPFRILVVILLFLGIVLRVLFVIHPLPINVDEANVVDRALRLFAEGPNPRWFHYPSLFLYLVALSEGVLFCFRWVLGLSATPEAFTDWYFTEPLVVYMTARLWSLGAGVTTLWLVYRLGERLASPPVGLGAAAFLAVSPMHLYYSAIAKPDAAMVLAMYAAGLLAVAYLREQRSAAPWGAAIMGGLAATLKYPGGAAWLAAPAALFLRPSSERHPLLNRLGQVALLGVLAALVFVAGTPFAIVEPTLVHRDLGGHVQTVVRGLPGMEGITTWDLYVGRALPYALSYPLLGLAAWGLVVLLRQDWRGTVVALVPAAAYAVPTFAASLAQFGFVLPLVPALCLCAGAGLDALSPTLSHDPWKRLVVQGSLALLCVASPVSVSICELIKAQRPTAQERAEQWIREHLPAGSRILGTATGMTLPLTGERLVELLAEATQDRPTGGARMRFLQRTTPPGKGYAFYDMQGYEAGSKTGEPRLTEYDPEWITRRDFQYVVDNEERMRRFFGAPDKYPLPFRFQRWLVERGELLYTTHPGSRGLQDWMDNPARVRALEPSCGFSGGEIRIYRIKESNAP